MTTRGEHLRFGLSALPGVAAAGEFLLEDRAFGTRYRSRTHALHLHDYAADLRLGERRLRIEPGDMTLTPTGAPSFYDLPTAGYHLCIHFHLPHDPPPGDASFAVPLHARLAGDRAYAAQQMRRITAYHASIAAHPSYGPSAGAALLELLLWLSRRPSPAGHARRGPSEADRAVARATRATRFIEEHLHEAFTVPQLAAHAGLSQNYLARRFKARLGVTIPRYLLNRRMALARQMLIGSDLPVKVIGARVGLPDPHHFNKQFRKVNGQSPRRFRDDAATEPDEM